MQTHKAWVGHLLAQLAKHPELNSLNASPPRGLLKNVYLPRSQTPILPRSQTPIQTHKAWLSRAFSVNFKDVRCPFLTRLIVARQRHEIFIRAGVSEAFDLHAVAIRLLKFRQNSDCPDQTVSQLEVDLNQLITIYIYIYRYLYIFL